MGRTVRGVCVAAACVVAATAWVATGAGASTSGSTGSTKATKQVTAAFVTLFNANEKNIKDRQAVLQDAAKYKASFTKLFTGTLAKTNPTEAKVTAVTFPSAAACTAATKSSKCAAVTYDIDTATTGSTLLTNVSGYAVDVKGHWLVSDATFCSLAKLAGASC